MGKASRARGTLEERMANPQGNPNRVFHTSGNVVEDVKKLMSDGYDYAIFIEMPKTVYIHGCYSNEVAREYHATCQKAYRDDIGFPLVLTNSRDPSGLVLPMHEIVKTIKNKSMKVEDGLYAVEVKGGQYKKAGIFFSAKTKDRV